MESEILDAEFTKYKLGSRWKRLIAYLFDLIGIIILINFIGISSGLMEMPFFLKDTIKASESIDPTRMDTSKLIIRYVSFLVWVIYSIIMDCSKYQGTFGKVLLGLKVVDDKGNKINFSKSLIRNSSKIISYGCILLGFLWILIDTKKRGWHDIIAKTLIIEDFK